MISLKQPSQRRSMFMMFLVTLMWSTSGLLIKFLPWNPMVIAGCRSLIAGLVMFFYIRLSGHKVVANKTSVPCGMLMCAMFFSYNIANKLTTSANAIVLQQTAPIFVLLYGIIFRRQRPRKLDLLTVALTLCGISLFFLDELSAGGLLGNLVAILAGFFVACQFVVQCNAEENTCLSGVLFSHIFTALVGMPMMLVFPPVFTFETVGAILALGVVQLGIPYVLFGLYAHHCTALSVSLISIAEAVFNPIWVALALGEIPSPIALLGALVVLFSVIFWSVMSSRKSASPSA